MELVSGTHNIIYMYYYVLFYEFTRNKYLIACTTGGVLA